MKKHTSGSTRRRRSHHALKDKTLNKCLKCGQVKLPHHACAFCGQYRGKAILKIKTKVKK